MNLNELTNDRNKRKNRKRVGRGIGSGKGKTGGRGQKGQTSRSGVSINGFEGGQMPIYRRLPKRGFVNPFRIEYQCVSLDSLQKLVDSKKIDASTLITKQILLDSCVITRKGRPVKVLAKGSIKSPVKVSVDAASKNAIGLIEKAGGKVEILATQETKAA